MPNFQSQAEALAYFSQLASLSPPELIGLWQGKTLETGHPLDGVLEALGWYGKRFHADRRADALLFSTGSRRLVPIDPKRIPLQLVLRFHSLAQRQWCRNLFDYALKGMWAGGTVASVRVAEFAGQQSAAMVYDSQPIIDHFRRIDADRLMGVMVIEGRGDHFFFMLERAEELQGGQVGQQES